jgi:TonB-dependent receptor
MLKQALLSFVLSVFSICLFAQTGTIKGNVKDAKTGEGVVGANVAIAGTTQGAAADINGDFVIEKVKAGTYDIIISFISYRTDTLKKVTVYPDQTTVFNTALAEESQQLGEVVVTGARVTNTDFAVITEIRKNDLVATGISAQQISMSQDRDAAQIMKRIPGVTILNNRFVNVRGLSERYSTVMLDGIIAPSSEVDSRAFAFDLIPSNMIDRMLVYKSGAAELPGEFGGAVINISTKSVVDESALSVNITGGFRANTTFQDFYTSNHSSTDALGFDNGSRDLPSSFPSQNLGVYNSSLNLYNSRKTLTDAALSLPNSWAVKNKSAAPDVRTTINFSKAFSLGSWRLSNISSLSYTNTRQQLSQNNYYYEGYDPSTAAKVGRRYIYNDERAIENTRVGLISNFILEINPKNRIEFRNLFNQQGTNEVTVRKGIEDVGNFEVNNEAINYLERGMYSGQLQGKHSLTDHFGVNWIFGYSTVKADQPDFRRIRSQRALGSNDPFEVVLPPNASTFDAGRFYSNLSEKIYTHALNLEYKINPEAEEDKQAKIAVGYYLSQTERDFAARWFSYKNSLPSKAETNRQYLTRPFDQIFTPETLANTEDNPQAGANPNVLPAFILDEGTNFTDKYSGKANLYAGYVSATIPFADKFRLATGLRIEDSKQNLDSYETNGNPLKVKIPVTSYLPFMNLSFNYSEKSLVRIAYSRTVNRPIFREFAPFNYYDFNRPANFVGNPDLTVATIDNADLRWENYPTKSEIISFGVFYKNFQKPIESRLLPGSNIIYSFINGKSAYSYGIETEVRKNLSGITGSGFVDKLSVLFNASLIKSKVTLPAEATNQDRNRAMQGQSPYVINAGLLYSDVDKGLQVNVAYNVFGKRIFAIGDFNEQSGVALNPTQYEMPRNQIDITISKDLNNHFNLKVGVQDLLNQKYRLMQDSNSDRKITSFDDPILVYRPGQYVTLGVTYKM